MAKVKKKPTGGKHVTKRVNVGFPAPWHAVIRRIAAAKRQPVIYALIELIIAESEARGFEQPRPPWELGYLKSGVGPAISE